jgi:hypothetical protein
MSFSRVTKSTLKIGQPLIQTLESRRLMSLTAPVAPPMDAHHPDGGQIGHSFGFEESPPVALPMGFNPWGQPTPATSGNSPDSDELQWPPGHAITVGTSVSVTQTASTAGISANTAAVPTTLSALYSSLGNSTVDQIDLASAKSKLFSLRDSLPDGTHNSFTPQSNTASAVHSQLDEGAVVTTQHIASVSPEVTSDKALTKAMSVFVTPLQTLPAYQPAAPTWISLRKLEDELIEVKAFANQVISEIGRESAIALAHLESMLDPSPSISGAGLNSWRSAIIAGAAIATASYFANDVKRENQKQASVFSTQLIEAV